MTLRELSLHILDIAENSVNAGARKIEILVDENIKNDRMTISVSDDGKGMSPEKMKKLADPFITTRTTRKVGLGIPFLKAAAEACNGKLEISSEIGKGTKLTVEFQLSHIDRMPLGNLQSTWLNLLIGYPDVNWILSYRNDYELFTLDDKEIKAVLEEIPLSDPQVIKYLKEEIANGFELVMKKADIKSV